MTRRADLTRPEALVLLLREPDPEDLRSSRGRRGHRFTQTRDPLRDRDALKRDLTMKYTQQYLHERGKDVSCIVSVRRSPRSMTPEIASVEMRLTM